MLNGTDQLGVINQYIDTARKSLGTLYQRKEALNQQLVQTRNNMTAQYRELARFRLDALAVNRLTSQLDQTDSAVLALLERRANEMARLEPEIEQSTDRQSTLNAQRSQAIQQRDELIKRIDERAAQIQADLSRQEGYQAQEKIAAQEAAKAARADRKATQAEADQVEKGKIYREDQLFMYLWERRFLTPDYKSRGLIRRLDGWVANIINYPEARSNYYMLTQLPVRLREHADRQKKIADQTHAELQALQENALNVDDILENKALLEETIENVEKIESWIEKEEDRYDALIQDRSKFSSGNDDISRQAIELQVSGIRNDSISELYMKAKATPKPDDDVIVSRIRDLKEEEKRVESEILALQARERQQQQSYRELEELRRRYRRRGYDSRHSHFPGGFELGALLALLMSGQKSGRDVWGQIDREQRFRKPRTPKGFGGGMFPGGFGGGMGGGGFGTGGGLGGGGFRTGGGF
jgi:hypothetical protein